MRIVMSLLTCWMIVSTSAGIAAEPAKPTGDGVIRGPAAPSEIVITTTARLAGAIHSLTWDGQEFIDSYDHGRQLQSASSFDCGDRKKFWAEAFNPTEAGSRNDGAGPTSTSRLLAYKASGRELTTETQMAFWLAPGQLSEQHPAKNTTLLSDHIVRKTVRIGYKQWPNAIEYVATFVVPSTEQHTLGQFEAVTGYMPPEFSVFYRVDVKTGALVRIGFGPGEMNSPVILSRPDSRHAMGIYSPDQPAKGYETIGYGRWYFVNERVAKWNSVFRVRDDQGIKPGEYTYRNFVVVGRLNDVHKTILELREDFKK